MKYLKIGYYHPTTANWSYGIFLVIDGSGARLYRETFGGDYRMAKAQIEKGEDVEQLYVKCLAAYKWSDVKNMPDIESYDGVNYPDYV